MFLPTQNIQEVNKGDIFKLVDKSINDIGIVSQVDKGKFSFVSMIDGNRWFTPTDNLEYVWRNMKHNESTFLFVGNGIDIMDKIMNL